MFTLEARKLGVKTQAESMGSPCLVEDPSHVLVRDGEHPAPALAELVQI